MDEVQKYVDRFYLENGPCCAGCDWWRFYNSVVGECTRSSPVDGISRCDMLGMKSISGQPPPSGHIMTKRDHVCGDFKDDFDWKLLKLKLR